MSTTQTTTTDIRSRLRSAARATAEAQQSQSPQPGPSSRRSTQQSERFSSHELRSIQEELRQQEEDYRDAVWNLRFTRGHTGTLSQETIEAEVQAARFEREVSQPLSDLLGPAGHPQRSPSSAGSLHEGRLPMSPFSRRQTPVIHQPQPIFPSPPLVRTPVASERSQSRHGSATAYDRSLSALFRRSSTTSTRRPQSRVQEAYIEDVQGDEEPAPAVGRRREVSQGIVPRQPATHAQPPTFYFHAPWLPRVDIRDLPNPYEQLRTSDLRQRVNLQVAQPLGPPDGDPDDDDDDEDNNPPPVPPGRIPAVPPFHR